jgi:hypothetical protein
LAILPIPAFLLGFELFGEIIFPPDLHYFLTWKIQSMLDPTAGSMPTRVQYFNDLMHAMENFNLIFGLGSGQPFNYSENIEIELLVLVSNYGLIGVGLYLLFFVPLVAFCLKRAGAMECKMILISVFLFALYGYSQSPLGGFGGSVMLAMFINYYLHAYRPEEQVAPSTTVSAAFA